MTCNAMVNIRANYLMGGIDEVFAQQSNGQTLTYLTDALGSTVRMTDNSGNKVIDYTYDPYGNTTADATIYNPFQYTGRENDGNGLYYYRARYYSPTYQRFISEDPIGLNGGINVYAYVKGNPISYIDPTGLARICRRPINDRTSSGPGSGSDGGDGISGPVYHGHIFYDDDTDVGYFDSGISADGEGNRGSYSSCREIGPDDEVEKAVDALRPKYPAEAYNPFFHNCQNFVNDVDDLVNPIPRPGPR